MNLDSFLLLLLALLLMAAMFFTLYAEGNRSRHGYGLKTDEHSEHIEAGKARAVIPGRNEIVQNPV